MISSRRKLSQSHAALHASPAEQEPVAMAANGCKTVFYAICNRSAMLMWHSRPRLCGDHQISAIPPLLPWSPFLKDLRDSSPSIPNPLPLQRNVFRHSSPSGPHFCYQKHKTQRSSVAPYIDARRKIAGSPDRAAFALAGVEIRRASACHREQTAKP